MTGTDPSPQGLRSYSVILAAEIGEPAAQMFHRIWYFCTRAKSGGRVIRGRRWIRNSHQQWQKDHFPHWSLSTVRRTLKTLTDEGLILSANHNREKYVTTHWYTVNPDHPLLVTTGYVKPKGYVQNEQGGCSKRTGGHVQNEQTGVFKMSASDHRDSSKKTIQGRPSSSLRGEEDELINKQISKMQAEGKTEGRENGRPVSADSGPEKNVPPDTEGDIVIPPPDPPDDLLLKVYGRVPPAVDFLAAEPRRVDLHPYLRPFKNEKELSKFFSKGEIRAMSTPGPTAIEAKCADFIKKVLEDHFVEEVRGGIRVMAMRAVRSGFLNRCGFRKFCERGLPGTYEESRPPNHSHFLDRIEWEEW